MGENSPVVAGIDLGTTYCSVASIDPDTTRPMLLMVGDDFDEYVPSMVAVKDGTLLVGKAAQDLHLTGDHTQVARLFKRTLGRNTQLLQLGRQILRPQDCATELLRHLKEGAEANLSGMVIETIVLTVPANFNAARRKATLDAAEAAGLKVLRLINEPTAALLAHATLHRDMDLEAFGRHIVFDFGGGTLDVTAAISGQRGTEDGTPILVASSLGRDVGGMDIDQLLVKELIEAFKARHGVDPTVGHPEVTQQLNALAIRLKEGLSHRERIPVQWAWEGKGLELLLSRHRFREITQSVLSRAFGAVDGVLQAEGWTWEDLDRLLLIGGSSLVPFVREYFLEKLPRDRISFHPQDCRKMVAYGAALTPYFIAADRPSRRRGPRTLEAGDHRSDALDVVFILDTTGSMYANIERIKIDLTAIMMRLHRAVPGFRLALIGYSDHDQLESEPFLLQVTDFSEDPSILVAEISKMKATFGGDDPEAVEDALQAAHGLSWCSQARKAIILVGDAPPHGLGAPEDAFPEGCPLGIDWEEAVAGLLDLGVVFYPVLGYETVPDPTAQRIWEDLATRSDGQYYELSDLSNIALLLEATCAARGGGWDTWLAALPAESRAKVDGASTQRWHRKGSTSTVVS